jgi:class 3 adenylate cyclase/tetratricopeptide (TPR) repeat protein
MKCPACQFENPDGMKFCGECGAKLERICPKCNFSNPSQFKFCGECGSNLGCPSELPPRDLSFDEKIDKIQRYLPKGLTEKILSQRDKIEGERKQVTVMFCDMEGFTRLSEKLGPEEAYVIMDQVYETLIHKVHDYEGTVNEMTGDGIMALFGAPIALEDAPQRAIRSAYSIHREMTKFNEKMKQDRQSVLPVKMRIGIHTGPVVVGTLGNNLRVEFKAVGDTVNLASRIEGLAEPGTTYVTGDTFKLTEGFFRFEALGEKEIKGKEAPVKIYRVIGPSTRRTRFDVSAERGLTPFVGRERELSLLLEGFERVKEGRGQAFSIVSEAGLGKSRLLYEFRKAVANEDVTFLEGKCLSYSRGVAYHPVIDILKSNFDISDSDRDIDIRGKVERGLRALQIDEASTLPYFLELLSVKDSGIDKMPMSLEGKKGRINEALNRNVLRGSEIRPMIMAVEDLHWIDKSSEERFKYLLDSISGSRVLLIFTYRPEFVHTWGGKSYHSQINLNRLSNSESLEMVKSLLDTEDLERNLEELILEKTEGVPFYIEEFIKSIKDLKIVERDANRYHLAKNIQNMAIPATIQDMIMARIDALTEEAKEVLHKGSVIEREFDYELLKQVSGLPEKELLSHLSVLKDSELLYERGIYPQSTYIFKHALTQVVAYDSLLIRRRKELHRLIGEAIEELYADRLVEHYEALAHHFRHSAETEKALHYLKFAARKAAQNNYFPEARRHYAEAVAMLDSMEATPEQKRQRSGLVLRWANVAVSDRKPEVLEALKSSLSDVRKLGDQVMMVRLSRQLGNFQIAFGDMNGFATLGESFDIAEKLGDETLIAMATDSTGRSMFHGGRNREAVEWLERSIPLLKGMGHTLEAHFSSGYLAMSYAECGDFKEAKRWGRKGLEGAEKLNHPGGILFTRACLGRVEMKRGDWGEGEMALMPMIEPSRNLEWPHQLAEGTALLGLAAYRRGHNKRGLVQIVEGTGYLEPVGSHSCMPTLPLWYGRLAQLNAEQGQWTEAEAFIEKCMEIDFEWNAGRLNCELAKALMAVHLEPCDWQEAEGHADKALKLAEKLELRPDLAIAHLDYAKLLAEKGDVERTKEQLQFATDLFTEMEMTWWLEQAKEFRQRLIPI